MDAYFVDTMFIVQCLATIPITYATIAESVLKTICKLSSKKLYFVCNSYQSPSINDIERMSMGASTCDITIIGPLLKCLPVEWGKQTYSSVIADKEILYCNGDTVKRLAVQDGMTVHDTIDGPPTAHEEADARLIYHLCKGGIASVGPLHLAV